MPARRPLDEETVAGHHGRLQPVGQAEGERFVGRGQHGQRVRLEAPEPVVVDQVAQCFVDGIALALGDAARAQPVQALAQQVLQGDAVGLGILGDGCGGQVDRQARGRTHGAQALDVLARRNIDMQHVNGAPGGDRHGLAPMRATFQRGASVS
jgi:hypothetical protein